MRTTSNITKLANVTAKIISDSENIFHESKFINDNRIETLAEGTAESLTSDCDVQDQGVKSSNTDKCLEEEEIA